MLNDSFQLTRDTLPHLDEARIKWFRSFLFRSTIERFVFVTALSLVGGALWATYLSASLEPLPTAVLTACAMLMATGILTIVESAFGVSVLGFETPRSKMTARIYPRVILSKEEALISTIDRVLTKDSYKFAGFFDRSGQVWFKKRLHRKNFYESSDVLLAIYAGKLWIIAPPDFFKHLKDEYSEDNSQETPRMVNN